MLVLTRKKGESIRIGDEIEIKVLSVDQEGVKIGIVAPRSLGVHRQEVYEAIQKTNRESVTTNQADLMDMKRSLLNIKKSSPNDD